MGQGVYQGLVRASGDMIWVRTCWIPIMYTMAHVRFHFRGLSQEVDEAIVQGLCQLISCGVSFEKLVVVRDET